MLGLGLGVDKSRGGFGKFQYLSELPSFVPSEYSLAFDASGAETLNDYEANTLYFRDSNFDRVGATFSRTTTATRVNKQGLIETVATNVPRIDYTDGSAKLLMEPSRTNIIRYSEEFDDAAWTLITAGTGVNPVVTANAGIAPDGTLTADRVFLDVGAGTLISDASIINQLVSVTAQPYSFTFYAKSNTGSNQFVQIRSNSAPFDYITITPEWKRFTIINTPVAGNRGYGIDLRGNNPSGQKTCDILIWGAQLEAASYPTSYIPTSGSAVTRNADVLQASGIASHIPQVTGVQFYDCVPFDTDNRYISISDGTINNTTLLGFQAGTNRLRFNPRVSGVAVADITGDVATAGTRYKLAARYKENDFALAANGLLVGTDLSGATFADGDLTDFVVGNGSLSQGVHGRITSMLVLSELTNAELEQLTS